MHLLFHSLCNQAILETHAHKCEEVGNADRYDGWHTTEEFVNRPLPIYHSLIEAVGIHHLLDFQDIIAIKGIPHSFHKEKGTNYAQHRVEHIIMKVMSEDHEEATGGIILNIKAVVSI